MSHPPYLSLTPRCAAQIATRGALQPRGRYQLHQVMLRDPFFFPFWNFQSMTMMFEVQDLAVASPATVSRCGMVYLEPSILGLEPFTECWLQKLPDVMQPFSQQLASLFTRFLKVTYRTATALPQMFYFLIVLWTQSSLVQLHFFHLTVELLQG